jgi:hypothetical protein
MDAENAPSCIGRGNPMTYARRTSLPPEIIYRCERCSTEIWIGNSPQLPAVMGHRQTQQQRQPPLTKTSEREEPI